MTDATLLTTLKSRIGEMAINMVDIDLTPHDTTYLRYDSENPLWLATPPEKIRVIAEGVESYLFPTDYTVDTTGGYITLNEARSEDDIVRADYTYFPFTDADLLSMMGSARITLGNLVFRQITEPYNVCYQEALLKKTYSLCLRKLQFPTVKYFSISVGGRAMDKSTQVANINLLIDAIEKELLQELNMLRYYNKDNVLS